jgi:hypothetical protein
LPSSHSSSPCATPFPHPLAIVDEVVEVVVRLVDVDEVVLEVTLDEEVELAVFEVLVLVLVVVVVVEVRLVLAMVEVALLVVVVEVAGWRSLTTSDTKASTWVSMVAASPLVVQPRFASAREKVAKNLISHRSTQRASTAVLRRAAVASQRSLQADFRPAPRIFAAAQSFSAGSSVHRAVRTACTWASTLASIAAASPTVAQPPRLSALPKDDVNLLLAWARHAPSTAAPRPAALPTHRLLALVLAAVAPSFAPLQRRAWAGRDVTAISADTARAATSDLAMARCLPGFVRESGSALPSVLVEAAPARRSETLVHPL